MMNIINLTPHAVNLLNDEFEVMQTFESAGLPPVRLSVQDEIVECVNGIPVYKAVFGEAENLPEEKEDTMYIVSRMVVDALPSRSDLVSPYKIVREDEHGVRSADSRHKGNIVGCLGFAK